MPEVRLVDPFTGDVKWQHVPNNCSECRHDVDDIEGFGKHRRAHAAVWDQKKFGPAPNTETKRG